MDKRKVFNICLAAVITIIFMLSAALVFNISYLRTGEAFRDFGLSVAYYFCELFGIESGISPTVVDYSGVLQVQTSPPESAEGFAGAVESYAARFFSIENFSAYWGKVGEVMFGFAQGLTIALPVAVLLIVIVMQVYKKGNTKHNADTRPLKAFKWLSAHTYQPFKRSYAGFKAFLSGV